MPGPVRPRVAAGAQDGALLELPQVDSFARGALRSLTEAGHEAALVGGSLRDLLIGHAVHDWDIATSARPEQVVGLFDATTWENRFGTVTVHGAGNAQVTTYRAEGGYSDRRRPDDVRFGVSLSDDLGRRDFTINAMAWIPTDLEHARGRLVDPHGGLHDLRAGLLQAVGDPDARFAEDALRLLRAVRLSHRLGLRIDHVTEAAIRRLAPSVAGVSGERVRDELLRILSSDAPSEAFALMERLGLLSVLLPEVAALRGVPQDKVPPGDALDHALRAVDAVEPPETLTRLAALLHDVGKASTLAGGHFIGHETVGAELAGGVMRRLRFSRAETEVVVHAVRHHMYAYAPDWTDAAVRRFIRRIGPFRLETLFALRRADNLASGAGRAGVLNQRELESRIRTERERGDPPWEPGNLAVDGHDLQRELGLEPGPLLGGILDRLTEAVTDDPALNERGRLLDLARRAMAER
ncbi:MAG: CCA tRNA nucleotidyltransferase [Candidatus Limnocylindria bacterium]